MESRRLLFTDGDTLPLCRPAGKTQRDQRSRNQPVPSRMLHSVCGKENVRLRRLKEYNWLMTFSDAQTVHSRLVAKCPTRDPCSS